MSIFTYSTFYEKQACIAILDDESASLEMTMEVLMGYADKFPIDKVGFAKLIYPSLKIGNRCILKKIIQENFKDKYVRAWVILLFLPITIPFNILKNILKLGFK